MPQKILFKENFERCGVMKFSSTRKSLRGDIIPDTPIEWKDGLLHEILGDNPFFIRVADLVDLLRGDQHIISIWKIKDGTKK